jgi:hypothetical protein
MDNQLTHGKKARVCQICALSSSTACESIEKLPKYPLFNLPNSAASRLKGRFVRLSNESPRARSILERFASDRGRRIAYKATLVAEFDFVRLSNDSE